MRPLEEQQRDALKHAKDFVILNARDITQGPAKRLLGELREVLSQSDHHTELKWPVR